VGSIHIKDRIPAIIVAAVIVLLIWMKSANPLSLCLFAWFFLAADLAIGNARVAFARPFENFPKFHWITFIPLFGAGVAFVFYLVS
jgi:hypothetical protein